MKKFLKKGFSLFLLSCLVVTSSIVVSAANDEVEVPNNMQPDSIFIYDSNLNYEFERGGEIDVSEEEGSDIAARPGMRAVYDDDGLLRNVYYPVPGEPGSYQLSDPMAPMLNSGVNAKGSGAYSYGDCVLTFGTSNVTGKGHITYYGKPDNPNDPIGTKYPGDHNVNGKQYYLKMGDCATKMKVDDVPTGVEVTAKNTKNGNSMTFTKKDCGGLPNAILDIFEDGNWSKKTGICGLTVNGVKDSVDNGTISHKYN